MPPMAAPRFAVGGLVRTLVPCLSKSVAIGYKQQSRRRREKAKAKNIKIEKHLKN